MQKGRFASELISRTASGPKGQTLDHWGLIAQLRDTQGISGKHWDLAGSLGAPKMHSCFGGFVFTLAFFSSKGTSTPGVLTGTEENTGSGG